MKDLSNYNIIVIGDSISRGFFFENQVIKKIEHSAIDSIEQMYSCKIHNLSVFGQTLKRAYEKKFHEKAVSLFEKTKQNVVVIALGGNDADYDWAKVEQEPNKKHFPKTKIDEFEKLLGDMIEYFQRNNAKVIVNSIFPIDSQRFFENVICKKYDSEKILEFLKNDVSNLSRHQESFNNTLVKVISKTKCQFLDYRSPILLQNDFLSYICEDGIHPNEKGHNFIARIICKYIEKQDWFTSLVFLMNYV